MKIISCLLFLLTFAYSAQAAESPALYQLSTAQAEEAVGHALADKGAGHKVTAQILSAHNEPFYAYEKAISAEIRGLQYDKTGKRWTGSMVFLNGETVVSALPISGRYEETAEVPVLRRDMRKDDIIKLSDLEIKDVPVAQIRADTVTDMDTLIGKSPLRIVTAGRPLREAEIARPAAVKKNSMVDMHYTAPGMEIKATGQAMADGAKGDVISIRNTASKKIVQAVVVDSGNVSIVPAATSLSDNGITPVAGVIHVN